MEEKGEKSEKMRLGFAGPASLWQRRAALSAAQAEERKPDERAVTLSYPVCLGFFQRGGP
jgi:hypothetical protein